MWFVALTVEALQQLGMQSAVAEQAIGRKGVEWTAVDVRDHAGGFTNEDHAGGHIPGVIVKGVVGIESAGSHVSKVERRGTGAPQGVGAESEITPVLVQVIAV